MKEALISYIEQVHLWCKRWSRMKSDLIFEENVMHSEKVLQMFRNTISQAGYSSNRVPFINSMLKA